jgi:hypothetical protein
MRTLYDSICPQVKAGLIADWISTGCRYDMKRPGFARGSARCLMAADAAGCRLSGKSRVPGLRCPV